MLVSFTVCNFVSQQGYIIRLFVISVWNKLEDLSETSSEVLCVNLMIPPLSTAGLGVNNLDSTGKLWTRYPLRQSWLAWVGCSSPSFICLSVFLQLNWKKWSQSVQTWYREWLWHILEIVFWGWKVTITWSISAFFTLLTITPVTVDWLTTAIQRGFELYECLLV